MKNRFAVLFFLLLSHASFSQSILKQIDELDTAFYHNDYVTAKKIIDKIYISATTDVKNDTVVVEFLGTCGAVYYHTGEYDKAIDYFTQASDKALKMLGAGSYHYSLALFNIAACYKEQGRYVEAEPLYLKSLPALAPFMGQSSLQYTRCFYSLAMMYIEMGKYTEAESMCAAAVNFYKAILGQTSDDYLGALGSMAVIYQGQAKYEKAEEIFLSLKKYHTSLPSPSKVTLQVLENNLGELYRHMADYEKAETFLVNAVALAGDDLTEAASSLNNLGLVQKATGNYAGAERSYKKAIANYIALGKTNHPDYTNPVNNLGELYRTMGRLQEAVYAFEEVIVLRKKFLGTEHPNYANAVNNLALVEFAIGKYADAATHLAECRDIYKRTLGEKDKFYANSLNNLASVYKAAGKLQLAEENYKECLRIFKATYGETSDKYGTYLGGLAGTYRQMKRYDEAIALTLQSLLIIKNKLGESHYDHIETEFNLAETYREAGKFEEAKKHYLNSMKGYLLLIEKYFPYLGESEKTHFYNNVSYAFELFNSFVIEQQSTFPAKDHTALVERMYDNQVAIKSLLLKESEAWRNQIAASGNDEFKKQYQQWIRMRENIVQHYRLSSEELETRGVSLPVLELQANELEQKIAIALKSAITPSVKKNNSWRNIQAKLRVGECAVEIVRVEYYINNRWTDTVYYAALLIDKQSAAPRFILLNNGNNLEGKNINGYRIAIKSKLPDEVSYDAFWKPLKELIGKASKVYFSPDGVYQQLNLYTLKNPETKRYLIEETDISLVTNTSDILQPATAVASKKAEIFSFPDYGVKVTDLLNTGTRLPGFPDLKELPGTKIESDSIKKILTLQQWQVQDHLQKEATEEAIKKISHPQVLHIATHGFFLKNAKESKEKVFGIESKVAIQNPLLRSGLILAGAAAIAKDTLADNTKDDGILTAYEAAGLDLAGTDLVVLSACETGLGELMNAQGVFGLQRSFLVAGAQSVIMSLWVIDDFATQELMTHFYREWLKNPVAENKQKAFRAAQLKLKEKFPHPYYWGAFVMVGN
ncbi:MAG: CHAT domain-containing tetratricopeptide repeat protein [Chitinophagaceae bacterium]